MRVRVLLVEDEDRLARTIVDRLGSEGMAVTRVADGDAGFDAASRQGLFDVIVLDLMLPRRDGYSVCRDLRAAGVETPILMLTARSEVTDCVVGLKLGADDYVTKPFDAAELVARIEALLRRSRAPDPREGHRFSFGDVEVDFHAAEVRRAGVALELSAKEYQLLCYFIERKGILLTRDELLQQVWGHDVMPVTRTVDVHVTWLRSKIEPDRKKPRYIRTLVGLGYKFIAE